MKWDSELWPHALAKHHHQLGDRAEVAGQLPRRPLHGQPRAQVRLLGGDAHRAVVGVARPHPDAADRLQRHIGHRDRVGAQGQRLHHVLGAPEAAGRDERDVAGTGEVEVAAGPGQRRHGRHADRVAEDRRGGAGAAAAAVEDHVVHAEVQRGVEVGLDVLGRHLHPDRDPAGTLPDPVHESAGVEQRRPVGEAGRGDRRRALRQAADLGDPPDDLVSGEMAAGAGLRALAELEVQCLHPVQAGLVPAETARGQLVEVAGALGLLLGEHPALAGADRRARPLGAAPECGLGLG